MNKDATHQPRTFLPFGGFAHILFGLLWLSLAPPAWPQDCGDSAGGSNCAEPADPGSTPRHYQAPRHVGNPIDVVSGNKYQIENDIEIEHSKLVFKRHYNTALTTHNIRLGQGWRHTYSVVLSASPDGSLQIVQSDGRKIRFSPAVQTSESVTRYDATVAEDGFIRVEDGHSWHIPDGRVLKFKGSFLTSIHYQDGGSLQLHYDQQRLVRVDDEVGNRITINYSDGELGLSAFDATHTGSLPGHIQSVEASNGQKVVYTYDAKRNLVKANDSVGGEREYRYELDALPQHLTGYSDSNDVDVTQKHWRYDSDGRAIGFAQNDKPVLNVRYSDKELAEGIGYTDVDFAGGRTERYIWSAESDGVASHVKAIAERNCDSCPTMMTTFNYDNGQVQGSYTRQIHKIHEDDDEPPKPNDAPPDDEGLLDVPYQLGNGVTEQQSIHCSPNYIALCDRLELALEYALLSSCAYSQPETCGDGWVIADSIGGESFSGHISEGLFDAVLYYHPEEDRYVLAFAGTDEVWDMADNIAQGYENTSAQYEVTEEIVRQLETLMPDADITYTGHSLGGGLASYASWLSGNNSFVFNPSTVMPGLDPDENINYGDLDELVDKIVVESDPLTNLMDLGPDRDTGASEFNEDPNDWEWVPNFPAPGRTLILQQPSDEWLEENQIDIPLPLGLGKLWEQAITPHGIAAVIESIHVALAANNC
ncbi:MAG: lipase family protein [Granulosicoccus sp.]|nr:lipase family protein [Granulosicoccus sp.]